MGKYKNYDHILKYKIVVELTSPMHVGASFSDRNEVLVHPVDGLPFVQASSIAGVIRDYFERSNKSIVAGLFGSTDDNSDSRVVFSDGIFIGDINYEMRPRVQIDPVSGTTGKSEVKGTGAVSGHKFDMECISKGAKFCFELYVWGKDFNDDETMMEAFSAFNGGDITLGGQKSNGYGDVKITSLLVKRFDLKNDEDLKQWLSEANLEDSQYDEKCKELKDPKGYVYRLVLKGMTESSILIKGYKKEGFGKDGADAVNMQDASGNYIIPGSSIKGSVRSQIDRILSFKGLTEEVKASVLTDIFGDAKVNGRTGNIRVHDTTIEVPKSGELPITNRIHIDKLTGGVMNSALFNEQKAYGNVEVCVEVLKKSNAERSCGYFLLALRDLAANLYNLGGGYSIGDGMIKTESIEIESEEGVAVIDMLNGVIKDDKHIIDKCIKATEV